MKLCQSQMIMSPMSPIKMTPVNNKITGAVSDKGVYRDEFKRSRSTQGFRGSASQRD